MKYMITVLSIALVVCMSSCLVSRSNIPAPRILEPTAPSHVNAERAADATSIHLAGIHLRPHIPGTLIIRKKSGAMVRDESLYWSSSPADYLREFLESAISSRADLYLSDTLSDALLTAQIVALAVVEVEEGFAMYARVRVTWQSKDFQQSIEQIEVTTEETAKTRKDIPALAGACFGLIAAQILEAKPK